MKLKWICGAMFVVSMVSEVLIASSVAAKGYATLSQTGIYGAVAFLIGIIVAIENGLTRR